MTSRFGLKPSCLSQKSATVDVTRPNLLSDEPRPYTKPFSTTASKGSRSQSSRFAGTTSMCEATRIGFSFGSVPRYRAVRVAVSPRGVIVMSSAAKPCAFSSPARYSA